MADKEIILIPYWVEKVLTRNKLNLDTVLNFGELSKVLSTNDIAQMKALEDYEINTLNFGLSNDYLARSWYSSAQGSQKAELDFVETMAREGEVVRDLITRLSRNDTDLQYSTLTDDIEVKEQCYFNFVDINKEISAIIVNDNFLTVIGNKDKALELVSAVLKNLYTYYTVAQVAAFKVFDEYITLLNQKAL